MQQLIEIKTIPIAIDFKITEGQFVPAQSTAELEMHTDKGGLEIKSRPIKLNIDTYEARKSASNESATDSVKSYASAGKQAAYEATARYVQEGDILMNVKFTDDALNQIADLRLGTDNHITPNIKWIPDCPADITFEPGEMSIKYEMDKLNFDFKQNKQPLKFVPGDIEFIVTQRPQVIVKYIGGPIYVPPSADPDYVDTEV